MDNQSNEVKKENCQCSCPFMCGCNEWMRNILIVFGVVLTLFFVIKVVSGIKSFGYIGKTPRAEQTITFTGKGEVFAIPDIASFSFGVSKDAMTVSEAQGLVTEKMNASIDAVKKMGVDEKDIKTVDYSIYPKYDYESVSCRVGSYCPPGKQILAGYTVTQSVSVKVRKVSDAGKILGAVGELGATNVSGLNFTVDDEDKFLREARQEAIKDAKEKAQALSKDLGVRLGDIMYFSESGGGYYYANQSYDKSGGAMVSSAPMPEVLPGQNKITTQVNITYQLK